MWTANPVAPSEVTAQYLYDIGKRHRLIPDNVSDAVGYYRGMADCCAVLKIESDDGDMIADLIIMDIVDGVSAEMTLIPRPQYFAPGEDFSDLIQGAITPVTEKLFEARSLRRISAFIPKTRSRTAQALRACGFNKEGVMRDAIKFVGKDEAEDMVIMGLLPNKE